MAFKKKDRKNDNGDRDSKVAVEETASRSTVGGLEGSNFSDSPNGERDSSASLQGSSVATVQGTRPSGSSEGQATVGDKVAVPFKGRLGDLLIEGNLIDEEQLEKALARQQESGGRLGEVLVGMGFLDARALADALAAVLGLEVLNLRRENVEPAALALVSEEVARTQLAIPVRFEGNYLQIAVA